jgi:hypothetical protein
MMMIMMMMMDADESDARRCLGSPAAGLVHTAVLMGAPVPASKSAWLAARSVVADRLVNCFSKRDWVLGLVYRYQKLSLTASGIDRVPVGRDNPLWAHYE